MVRAASANVFTAALVTILLSITRRSEAIWLTLHPSIAKCISEEIHNSIVVLADYIVISSDDLTRPVPTVSCKVTSPYGNVIHNNHNVTHGQFAFTSSETGNYMACFAIDGKNQGLHRDVNINLIWKMGVHAKDWEEVARKQKLEGVELELTKLEEAVVAVHENLLYLRSREAEMRGLSEITNSRISWLSILSMGICIVASMVQLFHLKKYFQKRKLI